jgi:hypothetical protein
MELILPILYLLLGDVIIFNWTENNVSFIRVLISALILFVIIVFCMNIFFAVIISFVYFMLTKYSISDHLIDLKFNTIGDREMTFDRKHNFNEWSRIRCVTLDILLKFITILILYSLL